jgi:hypothetical protein
VLDIGKKRKGSGSEVSKDTTIGWFHAVFTNFFDVVLDSDFDFPVYLKSVCKAS